MGRRSSPPQATLLKATGPVSSPRPPLARTLVTSSATLAPLVLPRPPPPKLLVVTTRLPRLPPRPRRRRRRPRPRRRPRKRPRKPWIWVTFSATELERAFSLREG